VLPPLGWVIAGVWGALWGSFFNVAIYRVGLYESVTRPRSRCPHCGLLVRAIDNIPILSWLMLRGRCRGCKNPISIRYPLVEALSCVLALAIYWRFVATDVDADPVVLASHFFVYFAFAGTMLVLSGIDLDHMMIPDRITYPAIPIAFVCGVLLHDVPPRDLLFGMLAGYGIVAFTIELAWLIIKKEAMGYGDAKLLAIVGGLLGWKAVVFAYFGASFLGLPVTLVSAVFRKRKIFSVEVPYGPYLAAAAVLYLFVARYLPEFVPR
jgi:leader peptidase (prepilin peptidase)/N-methyltransferase